LLFASSSARKADLPIFHGFIITNLNESNHRRNVMNMINLEDAKVSYEGQTLPAINLIAKLQTQLREAASRMAAIDEALGNLQTALLNSHSFEVKLTLSKEDYNKFRSLGGIDDNERIRNAVMNMIHTGSANIPSSAGDARPAMPSPGSSPASSSAESQIVITKSSESILPPDSNPPACDQIFPERPIITETPMKRKFITKCPTCLALIDLPEASNDQQPFELKCSNCGSKCIVSPSFQKPK
jgi:hypothetical protein